MRLQSSEKGDWKGRRDYFYLHPSISKSTPNHTYFHTLTLPLLDLKCVISRHSHLFLIYLPIGSCNISAAPTYMFLYVAYVGDIAGSHQEINHQLKLQNCLYIYYNKWTSMCLT